MPEQRVVAGSRRHGLLLLLIGLALIIGGAALAHEIRTAGGTRVSDIRFAGADGTMMSALLYVPAAASAAHPAPGVLAVHGYINTREMQDGFAIEFARRGYVVLELDQTGHGYSGGSAFANGFGGPDGLRYLRRLPFVDRGNIGLEGHSMGGWAVLAAAAAMPDAYRAMVLEGSAPGAPFAKEGSPAWPRNLAVVFSRFDEFGRLMWGVDGSAAVGASPKLEAVFGTKAPVVPGRLYGHPATGTARALFQPAATHPGDHISTVAIGDAVDWFAATLAGGHPVAGQIWYWKEFGTGIGLVGFLLLLAGSVQLLLSVPAFAGLSRPAVAASAVRDRRWWIGAALASVVPALLFFPAFVAVALLLAPAGAPAVPWWLPQIVTTQVAVWALLGAGVGLAVARFGPARRDVVEPGWGPSLALALATIVIGYAVLWFVDVAFGTDLRFWVVALKLPSARQWAIATIYVVPITLAFVATLRGLAALSVAGDGRWRAYLSAKLVLAGAFTALVVAIYAILFATGRLVTAFDPLSTVIAIQFVPLLAAIAMLATFCWRRTGSHRPAALIVGMLVTLYVCAGTATQG